MTLITFIFIGIILAFDDALLFKYKILKEKHYLFVKYEWWFNPFVSFVNKDKIQEYLKTKLPKWLWFLSDILTPLSDQKHVNRVLIWLLMMCIVGILLGWLEALICGVIGVYLSFNPTWKTLTKEKK